ncbi:PREDICTED: uncharacterized protein LOC109463731 [Branchiostoma belcheri]|uniref:Uncharacterized protein LOC109463731 n=1 Tax=Branchiostoma belcheri TaxID=7741 RepID=A0A6P4YBG5_BRABE|nr:PREDICTED: uncharacterized protein LOC109463731 [Branchiostoma belcheri]
MNPRPVVVLWLLLLTLDQSAAECCDPTRKVCSVNWFIIKAGCTKYCGDGTVQYDSNVDQKLTIEEAIGLLEALEYDVTNLPADWFTSMDLNGNGFIDPGEFDKDMVPRKM